MNKYTYEEVKDLYCNLGYSKTRIAEKFNVTYDEINSFMMDNAIFKKRIEISPVGRVRSSQSPIMDSQTVSMDDLKQMLMTNGKIKQ